MRPKKELDLGYGVSAHLAYWHAQDFKEAAEIIYGRTISKPVIVNLALACELYIKALLMVQCKSQDVICGHKLSELFGGLDVCTQERIMEGSDIQNWDKFMQESSNSFEEWRYYYEKDKCMVGHIPDLFRLAEVLNCICEERFPAKEK